MHVGLDLLPQLPRLVAKLRDRRVGLLAHPASVDRNLTHISQVLAKLGIRPSRIFGPEHGYGGEAQDMIGVRDSVDPASGAPIVSLYGARFEDLSPSHDQLQDLDVLLIDLSDVGSRYYTFVWTAWLALQRAHGCGIQTVVLDRPNPIGGLAEQLEGRPQAREYLSFVGLEPLPVRHSLTVGEILGQLATRERIAMGFDEALDVVGVIGWDRRGDALAWDRPFVMPSPNMPTVDTALVYPGGCLLEGTNLSEGRGTTRPFELLGAPWLDGHRLAKDFRACHLPGVVLRPLTFCPTFHKHAERICGGVQVHVTDRQAFRPLATYVAIVALAAYQAPDSFQFRTEKYEFVEDKPAIDLLTGSSELRQAIAHGESVGTLVQRLCPVTESDVASHADAVARMARFQHRR